MIFDVAPAKLQEIYARAVRLTIQRRHELSWRSRRATHPPLHRFKHSGESFLALFAGGEHHGPGLAQFLLLARGIHEREGCIPRHDRHFKNDMKVFRPTKK